MPKYDTNPLDPEFPEKVKASSADADAAVTSTLHTKSSETRQFAGAMPIEEQTRRFNGSTPYSPPFNSQYVPMNYNSATADMNRSSSRKVDKVGLPENVLTAVPYIPWYLGMIAGL